MTEDDPTPATLVIGSTGSRRAHQVHGSAWLRGAWVLVRHPDGSITAYSSNVVDRVEFHKP